MPEYGKGGLLCLLEIKQWRKARGRMDRLVQYSPFHARFDWYITMIFIIIPSSGHWALFSPEIFTSNFYFDELETCFPLRFKWEDCDDDPSRNKQRTTGVNRSRSLKVGKHCNDWLRTHQYELFRGREKKCKVLTAIIPKIRFAVAVIALPVPLSFVAKISGV